jgi:hypothetical protein
MFARASTVAITTLCLVHVAAFAQSQPAGPTILFENVRIFDGKSDTLSASMNVLVRGNAIDSQETRIQLTAAPTPGLSPAADAH